LVFVFIVCAEGDAPYLFLGVYIGPYYVGLTAYSGVLGVVRPAIPEKKKDRIMKVW